MRNSDTADPFDTDQIRARVLDAWRATPARFREDANTEEDFALGGYRDRLFVELLQNASDAAVAARLSGRVQVTIDAECLVVANTGLPLTAEGVQSLASMRASAKRDDTQSVGRFGVGFAAVLAVTDEPQVLSRAGGVQFSAERTADVLRAQPALTHELAHRDGHVPVLRLPFAAPSSPPNGYDVAVVLPFRDPRAREVALTLVESIDEALLVGLAGIDEVAIDVVDQPLRTLTVERRGHSIITTNADNVVRWRVASVEGLLPDDGFADRPTEERRRNGWSITWALPIDEAGMPQTLPSHLDAVVRTPTPTTDRLDFPALLIASFPMDSSRHHVETSSATKFLIDRAGETYAKLVCDMAEDVGAVALDLVPRPSLVGSLDTSLRRTVVDSLSNRPLATTADGTRTVAAADAVVLDPRTRELIAALRDVVDGLVTFEWSRSGTLVEVLGARTLTLPDLLDQLVELRSDPSWWRALYDALAGIDAAVLDGLPVPLTDGRVVRGVRSCVLPEGDAQALSDLGLRVIHPAAAHPLLARLGARPGDASSVLRSDELLNLLQAATETEEQEKLTRGVLALIADSGMASDDIAGLAYLLVPTSAGRWLPAGDVLLPGTPLAAAVVADAPLVDESFVGEVGRSTLVAVGALDTIRVVTHHDVLLDADSLADLMVDGELWAETVASLAEVRDVGGAIAAELSVVRGLELVRDDAWEQVWPLLGDPTIRRALIEQVAVVLGDGRRVMAPSMSGWWLSDVPLFSGVTPRQSCTTKDPRLVGVFEPVPGWAGGDDALLQAIGVASSVDRLLAHPGDADELLARLASADATPTVEGLLSIYRELADLPESRWPDPPERLRVVDGADTAVVPADDVTVITAPHHAVLVSGPSIEAPESLAEVLDLASSTDLAGNVIIDVGVERPVPSIARSIVSDAPAMYREHDDLVVGGSSVEWWVDQSGQVHASTMDGLARGLAWTVGHWSRRWELAAILAEPDRGDRALGERAFD